MSMISMALAFPTKTTLLNTTLNPDTNSLFSNYIETWHFSFSQSSHVYVMPKSTIDAVDYH